jgi:hypothetical protein
MVLAGFFGTLALGATLVAIARTTHEPWLAFAARDELPQGRELLVIVAAVLTTFALARLYAAWFDSLLTGNAFVRGLKFGACAWAWIAAIAVVVQTAGAVHIPTQPIELATVAAESLAPMLVLGAVVGITYGAGRTTDPYLHGIGYGLPDRRSLG